MQAQDEPISTFNIVILKQQPSSMLNLQDTLPNQIRIRSPGRPSITDPFNFTLILASSPHYHHYSSYHLANLSSRRANKFDR